MGRAEDHFREFALEQIRLQAQICLSRLALEDAQLGVHYLDERLERIMVQVRIDKLCQRFQLAEVEWPADWWQAFRQRWLPRRWLRRYPVRLERRRFEAVIVYPELKLALPDAPHGAFIDLIRLPGWPAPGEWESR